MYMRYAGGGVGHYRVTLLDSPANANPTPQEDFAMDDDIDSPRSIIITTTNLEECRIATETAGHKDSDVKEAEYILDDHHSDSESEEEDEENLDEDDVGAEDGEGGCIDAEDNEGYAAL